VGVGRSGEGSLRDCADSMLQFWLKRGGDGTKHYQKMKQRQQARLISMRRKRERGDVTTSAGGEATLGGEREETSLVGPTRILLG
jgi:hypothetical protein